MKCAKIKLAVYTRYAILQKIKIDNFVKRIYKYKDYFKKSKSKKKRI